MKKRLYKFIFCSIFGWKISGAFDPNIKKCVIVVMPHTSFYDFFVGLFARGIIGLEMNWVGKKELFRFPMDGFFRWMGGEPLDRSGKLNKVDSIVEIFNNRKEFRLAIAPEGTRKYVSEIKSGFYYIALKANVPIIPVAFDFAEMEVKIGAAFSPTGNLDSDFQIMLRHYLGVEGKVRQNGFDAEKFFKSTKP